MPADSLSLRAPSRACTRESPPSATSTPPPPPTRLALPPTNRAGPRRGLRAQHRSQRPGPSGSRPDDRRTRSRAPAARKLPSPARVKRASAGSIRRQLEGWRPDWEISRTHSAPRSKVGKRTPAEARKVGRGWTRIQASVITPRAPSEPMSKRSGLGPAPEPGRRREDQTPAGVSARDRLDEVLDVGPDGREMTGGSRGDPAA